MSEKNITKKWKNCAWKSWKVGKEKKLYCNDKSNLIHDPVSQSMIVWNERHFNDGIRCMMGQRLMCFLFWLMRFPLQDDDQENRSRLWTLVNHCYKHQRVRGRHSTTPKVVLGKKSTSSVQVPDAIALNAQIDCEQQLLRFLLCRL